MLTPVTLKEIVSKTRSGWWASLLCLISYHQDHEDLQFKRVELGDS